MPTPSSLKESSAANLQGSNSLPLLVQTKTSPSSLPSFAKPAVAARSSIHIARTPLAKEPSFSMIQSREKENEATLLKKVKDQNERVNKVGPFFSSFPASVTSTSSDLSRRPSSRQPPPPQPSNTPSTSSAILTSQVPEPMYQFHEKRDWVGLLACKRERHQELSALGKLRAREWQALQRVLAQAPTLAAGVEAECRWFALVTARRCYEQLEISLSPSPSSPIPAGSLCPPFPRFDPPYTKYLHTLFGTLQSMSRRLEKIAMDTPLVPLGPSPATPAQAITLPSGVADVVVPQEDQVEPSSSSEDPIVATETTTAREPTDRCMFGGDGCQPVEGEARHFCGKCLGVTYCCRGHQRSDWKDHKLVRQPALPCQQWLTKKVQTLTNTNTSSSIDDVD